MGTKLRWDRASARLRMQRQGSEQDTDRPTARDVTIANLALAKQRAFLDAISRRPALPAGPLIRKARTGRVIGIDLLPHPPSAPPMSTRQEPAAAPRPSVPAQHELASAHDRCRSCGAAVLWTITSAGSYLAVDPVPRRRGGTYRLVHVTGTKFCLASPAKGDEARGARHYAPHAESCRTPPGAVKGRT